MFGDLDNDGDLDLCLTGGPGSPTRLWRNETSGNNRWLQIVVRGRSSNGSGIGARVTVTTAAGQAVQEVSGGTGRGNQNELVLTFGLGQVDQVERLQAAWPSGAVQKLGPLNPNQRLHVFEPFVIPWRDHAPRSAPVRFLE